MNTSFNPSSLSGYGRTGQETAKKMVDNLKASSLTITYNEKIKKFTIHGSAGIDKATIQKIFSQTRYEGWRPEVLDETDNLGNRLVELRGVAGIDFENLSSSQQEIKEVKKAEIVSETEQTEKIKITRLSHLNPTTSTEVILAASPGRMAWDHTTIDTMISSLNESKINATIIGNGEQNISLESIIDAIEIAKQKKNAINLIIQSHGEIKNNEHQIYLNNKHISSRELFQQIKKELGPEYPLSIFTTACHGGTAGHIAAKELPKGAIFIALSRADTGVSGFDVERFINQGIPALSWHNSENLLYSYLVTLNNRYIPSITFTPNNPLDLEIILNQQIGKYLSTKQKQAVCQRLSSFLPESEVIVIIEKIEKYARVPQGESPTDRFSAKELGKALAVGLSIHQVIQSGVV